MSSPGSSSSTSRPARANTASSIRAVKDGWSSSALDSGGRSDSSSLGRSRRQTQNPGSSTREHRNDAHRSSPCPRRRVHPSPLWPGSSSLHPRRPGADGPALHPGRPQPSAPERRSRPAPCIHPSRFHDPRTPAPCRRPTRPTSSPVHRIARRRGSGHPTPPIRPLPGARPSSSPRRLSIPIPHGERWIRCRPRHRRLVHRRSRRARGLRRRRHRPSAPLLSKGRIDRAIRKPGRNNGRRASTPSTRFSPCALEPEVVSRTHSDTLPTDPPASLPPRSETPSPFTGPASPSPTPFAARQQPPHSQKQPGSTRHSQLGTNAASTSPTASSLSPGTSEPDRRHQARRQGRHPPDRRRRPHRRDSRPHHHRLPGSTPSLPDLWSRSMNQKGATHGPPYISNPTRRGRARNRRARRDQRVDDLLDGRPPLSSSSPSAPSSPTCSAAPSASSRQPSASEHMRNTPCAPVSGVAPPSK